ncbi:hypothetical protein [Lactiplantibacillus daowaiensis]|uniref:Prophage protein n=1 Tax=Lactiplantibacillus daowaiensis TaxID=2559918 RepID=A0ABW1RYR9_9LACO|nr:hypothetical protein [Lactiplantibacillus daowaiensis]
MIKVYKGWAFDEDEYKKRDINRESFKQLIERYKVGYGEENELSEYFAFDGEFLETKHCEFNELMVAFKRLPPTYNESHAQVIINKPRLEDDVICITIYDDYVE